MKIKSENPKNRLFVYFTVLLVISFLSGQSIFAQRESDLLGNKIRAAVDSIYTADGVPGITVGIYTPDFSFNYTTGAADLSTGRERKYDDRIRIGSITKTFIATVILQLADEGKLGLDDRLSKYFPAYPNSENITVRQMLDMTSGIPDYLEDRDLLKSFFYERSDKYTEGQIFEKTIALGPAFAPGKGWVYSNGNYNILGMMIEKITGNSIKEEVTGRIIKPLGLVNTFYPSDSEMPGQYSHGYIKDTLTGELSDATSIDPSITGAAGCMISNLPDLQIYAEALAKGTLLSKEMQAERLKFVNTGIKDFVKYGLGIFDLGGFIGHNGGITGYNTTMCYNPELDALILVSVNEFGPNGGISDKVFMVLADILYPGNSFFK
ncbi:MAG: beta-lactamase family protein [Bacteroidetes bacterium]|nr:beta-lactamase family protein [Bacteroidota bacterium]